MWPTHIVIIKYEVEGLDQDTVFRQFELLENKIEQLIEACRRRDVENTELRQNNDRLVEKLQEHAAIEKQNDEMKALVRSKIDSLMGRLSEVTEEKG
jgi:FtsZ-binding cell division protein ZapB